MKVIMVKLLVKKVLTSLYAILQLRRLQNVQLCDFVSKNTQL